MLQEPKRGDHVSDLESARDGSEKSSTHLKDERKLVAEPDALTLRLHDDVEGRLAGSLRFRGIGVLRRRSEDDSVSIDVWQRGEEGRTK